MKIGDLVRLNDIVGLIIKDSVVEDQPIPALWSDLDAKEVLYYVVWDNGMEFAVRPNEKNVEVISEA